MVQNSLMSLVMSQHLITHVTMSSGVRKRMSAAERASEASSVEQTQEWAVWANERTDERVVQYFSLYFWLFLLKVQCTIQNISSYSAETRERISRVGDGKENRNDKEDYNDKVNHDGKQAPKNILQVSSKVGTTTSPEKGRALVAKQDLGKVG